MASALCRKKFLTNLYVQKAALLDIKELNQSNNWTYVIAVSWSDGRETKVLRIGNTTVFLKFARGPCSENVSVANSHSLNSVFFTELELECEKSQNLISKNVD